MAALTIESALRGKLIQNATLSALISDRLYPEGSAPQTALKPYGTYQRITTENEHHMTAASGIQVVTLQVDWVGSTYSEVHAVADAARSAADGFRGTVTIGANTLTLKQCHLDGQSASPINPTDGGEFSTFVINQDWEIGAAISVPTF